MSVDDVVEHVKGAIDDPRISISLLPFRSEPSPISAIDSEGYKLINTTIREVFDNLITAPNLVLTATDGRYYYEICDNVYRFAPIRINVDNVNAIHGINEAISVEHFEDAIRFYIRLLENVG